LSLRVLREALQAAARRSVSGARPHSRQPFDKLRVTGYFSLLLW